MGLCLKSTWAPLVLQAQKQTLSPKNQNAPKSYNLDAFQCWGAGVDPEYSGSIQGHVTRLADSNLVVDRLHSLNVAHCAFDLRFQGFTLDRTHEGRLAVDYGRSDTERGKGGIVT